jgi:serine/threonine protein kinase
VSSGLTELNNASDRNASGPVNEQANAVAIRPVRVYVSYLRRDLEEPIQVVELCRRLRGDGVDAIIDLYEEAPAQGWYQWILNQWELADFHLIVFEAAQGPEIDVRSDGLSSYDADRSKLAFELHLAHQLFFEVSGKTNKIVPAVTSPVYAEHIPLAFRGLRSYDLSHPSSYEDLLRVFTSQARYLRKPLESPDEVAKLRLSQSSDDFSRETNLGVKGSGEVAGRVRSLEQLYAKLEDLESKNLDTSGLRMQILDLKRAIREGGLLKEGDLLADSRFKLLKMLGHGGFGAVFKAYDRKLRKVVAVKVLHSHLTHNETIVERFFRGARKMASLRHEGIVLVQEEPFQEDGYKFFCMEYLDGGSLEEALVAGSLTKGSWLEVIVTIGHALEHAHQHGIIHRDVKPSNILLDERGVPKLTDFDLVLSIDSTGGTRTGGMGSLGFAAPEILNNASGAKATADVYGLAMTAVALIRGGSSWVIEYFRDPDRFLKLMPLSPQVALVLKAGTEWQERKRTKSVAIFCENLQLASRDLLVFEKRTNVVAARYLPVTQQCLREFRSQHDTVRRAALLVLLGKRIGSIAAALELLDEMRVTTTNGGDLFWISRVAEDYLLRANMAGNRKIANRARNFVSEIFSHLSAPPDVWGRSALFGSGDKKWRPFWLTVPDAVELEVLRLARGSHRGFLVARIPVTNSLFEAFDPSHPRRPVDIGRLGVGLHPVVQVSWLEAIMFCKWMSQGRLHIRLPSVDEWQRMAISNLSQFSPRGDRLRISGFTAPLSTVGTSEAGNNAKDVGRFGTSDLAGNVMEWCIAHPGGIFGRGKDSLLRFDSVREAERFMAPVMGGAWTSSEGKQSEFRLTERKNILGKFGYVGFRMVAEFPDDRVAE